jgi:predicted transcriptional regulator
MKNIPETQLQSWDAMQEKLGNLQWMVFRTIKRDAATFFELERRTGLKINCITGRVNELVKLGLVRDSKIRRKNPTSGKSGIVWAVMPQKPKQEYLPGLTGAQPL